MVPITSEANEEARRAHREREDLVCERRSIVNRMGGILATLGVKGFKALRRDRREQLSLLRQPGGAPIPQLAGSRLERLLDRVELVLQQIEKVEKVRDAVLAKPAPANEARGKAPIGRCSSHAGTSSMGKLLALSLVTTPAAAVLFQPILMGPPRQEAST